MLKVFSALSHKEISCYSLSSIIFSLEMGMVEDNRLCMVLPYKLPKIILGAIKGCLLVIFVQVETAKVLQCMLG